MVFMRRLRRDERGFVATTDLLLLTTIVVLGLIVGLVSFRNQVVQEFVDVAMALGYLNQSYLYNGDNDGSPGDPPDGEADDPDQCFVAGSSYEDLTDFCQALDQPGQEPGGISVRVSPIDESTPLTAFP